MIWKLLIVLAIFLFLLLSFLATFIVAALSGHIQAMARDIKDIRKINDAYATVHKPMSDAELERRLETDAQRAERERQSWA